MRVKNNFFQKFRNYVARKDVSAVGGNGFPWPARPSAKLAESASIAGFQFSSDFEPSGSPTLQSYGKSCEATNLTAVTAATRPMK